MISINEIIFINNMIDKVYCKNRDVMENIFFICWLFCRYPLDFRHPDSKIQTQKSALNVNYSFASGAIKAHKPKRRFIYFFKYSFNMRLSWLIFLLCTHFVFYWISSIGLLEFVLIPYVCIVYFYIPCYLNNKLLVVSLAITIFKIPSGCVCVMDVCEECHESLLF